ncbi:MAG: CHAT domain-containing protein [Acidaminococcaceae bacterium]
MNNHAEEKNDFFVMINTSVLYSRVIANILMTFLRKNSGKCFVVEGVPLNTNGIMKYLEKTDKEEKLGWPVENRVQVMVPEEKSIQKIISLGADLSANDTLIVAGFERFISKLKVKSQKTVEYGDLKIRAFTKADIDWEGIDESLELLRSIKSNIVVLINCEDTYKDELFKTIETGDWDIGILEIEETDEDREAYNFQADIINNIGKVKKEELIKCIEESTLLPLPQQEILKAQVYIYYHDRAEAIKLLESQYDHLTLEQKKTFADLLDSSGRSDDALNILEEILKKDQFIHDLWPSILRTARHAKSTKFDEYIQQALKFDFQNEKIIGEAANYCVRKGEFSEAAKYWRIIFACNNNAYFEMLARVCDIEANPPTQHSDALAYIQEIADKHPELKNEANYRNGLIAFENYGSAFKGYHLLSNVIDEYDSNSYKAAMIRMDILQDPTSARRVQKRQEVLAKLKMQELYLSLDALSTDEHGCGRWQEFIEKSQSEEVWNSVVIQELTRWLKARDINSMLHLSVSSDYGDEQNGSRAAESVHLIRAAKALGIVQKEEIDAVISGAYYCLFYDESTVRQKLWFWYEVSILYSLLGRCQEAINASLMLWNYADRLPRSANRDLGRTLGFLAWGHSQFRIGNKIEGIICIMHSLQSFERKTGVSFFIEEALNIIFSWISTNSETTGEFRTTCQQFFHSLHTRYPEVRILEVMSKTLGEDQEEAYQRLKDEIVAKKRKDVTWVTHLANYITLCIQTNRLPEARAVLRREFENALPLLNHREDIKALLLDSWAQVFIKGMTLEDIRMAEFLLDIAIQSVEYKRNQIAFRTERSSLADISRKIYKTYLDVQGLTLLSNDFSDEEKKAARIKNFQTLNALALRSIVESADDAEADYSDDERRELEKIAKQYMVIADEVNRGAISNGIADIEKKAKECMKLLDVLKERHPGYKALPFIDIISPEDIVASLNEGDVAYQYIQTHYGFSYFIADNKGWDTGFILTEVDRINGVLEALAHHLQSFNEQTNGNGIEDAYYEISKVIHQQLINKLKSSNINRLLICPDMSITLYSSNLIRTESGWLIEQVGSIVNILGFSRLVNRDNLKDNCLKKPLIITLGENDNQLRTARAWAEQNKKSLGLVHVDDLKGNFGDIKKNVEQIKPSTIVIIAHGVSDQLGSSMSGAMYIAANDGAIWTDDLKEMKQFTSNVILLTCSSGTPQQGQVERGAGVWNGMMRLALKGTVLCRWDVNVKSSINIVDNLFKSQKIQLSEGLTYGQRETLKETKWKHPFYWAALEYWMN